MRGREIFDNQTNEAMNELKEIVGTSAYHLKSRESMPPIVVLLEERPINRIRDYDTAKVEFVVKDRFGNFHKLDGPLPGAISNIEAIRICAQVPSWDYDEYICSREWSRRKEEYFRKKPRECKICGSGKNIQLHHVNYERLGYEDDSDLVPLCHDCHFLLHQYLDNYKERVGDLAFIWCGRTRNVSNANNDNDLIKRFIDKYKENLDCIFADLPPVANVHKMKFISVFRDTAMNMNGNDCLPFSMLAKIINKKQNIKP